MKLSFSVQVLEKKIKIYFYQIIFICLVLLFGYIFVSQQKRDSFCSQKEISGQAPNRKQKEISWFKIFQKGKLGFIDETGEIIVEPRYNDISTLSSQRAVFEYGNKWGAMDPYGREIIEAKFEMLSHFENGRAAFQDKNKWGLIDLNGHVILNPFYETIKIIDCQRFLVLQNEKWGLIDLNGRVIIEPSYETIKVIDCQIFLVLQNEKWGLIDLNGRVIIEPFYETIKVLRYQRLSFLENKKWGLIDLQGNLISPPIFHDISHFSEGLAAFSIKDENNQLAQKGFIDPNGQIIFELPHNIRLSDDDSLVRRIEFNNGLLPVYVRSNFFSFLKKFGRARIQHTWGAIDREGRQRIPFRYDSIGKFSECLAQVKVNGYHIGFIDTFGKIRIKPQFVSADDFSEGFASIKIKRNGKKGYINQKGEIIAEPQFDRADKFRNGLARVRAGNKLGYINRQGEYVWSYYVTEEEKEQVKYW